jgi:hypothetical protein
VKEEAHLENCSGCGRLFAAYPGKEKCTACLTGLEEKRSWILEAIEQLQMITPQEIAEATGLDPHEIRRIVRDTRNLRNKVVLYDTCSKCGEHPPLPGSDFCLRCQLSLFKDFGDEARELSRKSEALGPNLSLTGSANDTRALLNRKRRRRLNPAPPYRIR